MMLLMKRVEMKLRSSRRLLSIVLIAGMGFMGCKKQPTEAESGAAGVDPLLNDNCYAPIRQPTSNDRDNWVKNMVGPAKDAEKIFGVPAAALIAMTTREGGYGLTRLYKGATNPYGFKWKNSEQAEGKPSWTLACQPKEDVGNKYVKFSSNWEATLFVAKKLATMERYKWVTDRYVKERRAGVDVKKAVDNWIVGISDSGYNYDPKQYKADIVKLANNYQSPSWTKSGSYNLYWVSGGVSPKSK